MTILTFHIDVTTEDIKRGQQGSCHLCPIARAASRSIGQPVRVGFRRIFVTIPEHVVGEINNGSLRRYVGRMPNEAATFVPMFDRGAAVMPFSFDIELVPFQGNDAVFSEAAIADAVSHDTSKFFEG